MYVICVFGYLEFNTDEVQAQNIILNNSFALYDDPIGSQILQWVDEIPNEGLLHFHGLLGSEYLIPTSIDCLKDVLIRRADDFTMPNGFRRYFSRFVGQSLLVEEGDRHKQLKRLFAPVLQHAQLEIIRKCVEQKSSLCA